MWEKRITHAGLNAYRLVRGQSQHDVEMKASLQLALWEERWQNKLRVQKRRDDNQAGKTIALDRTLELERQRDVLRRLLADAYGSDTSFAWESLKQRSPFDGPPPGKPRLQSQPPPPKPLTPRASVPTPQLQSVKPVVPEWSLLERLFPILRGKKQQAADELARRLVSDAEEAYKKQVEFKRLSDKIRQKEDEAFHLALDEFQNLSETTKRENERINNEYHEAVRVWQAQKTVFEAQQQEVNVQIDDLRQRYLLGEPDAIKSYCYEVLARSSYPDNFPRAHLLDITPEKTIVLDFELPSVSALPQIKEVKYVAARLSFQEIMASDAWLKTSYDEVMYQICLRTIYELFRSDEIDALRSVVFNGWVRSIDRATGCEVHACVMSLEAGKDEFLAINLAQVEPKACFKKLKGVSASKLIELSPVKPLVTINRDDKRFVDGYAVADALDERTNLAAMDWLDFENLIREVFGKEFSKGGGEVKITQASRDGGVDAIAFDPDPIRGGKIVIQAKRYTNTVGVSAVRDLYGTVHNEGANKGILVTTSDFGPDAYAFAKDKPLTLLSGGELLYLLAQHGHLAKIDLAEAKRIAAENGQ